MIVTLTRVLALRPCAKYRDVEDGGEGLARRWFAGRTEVEHTAVLRDAALPAADRVWLGVRLLSPRGRQLFAADCVEQRAEHTARRVAEFEARRPGDPRLRAALEAALGIAAALRGGDVKEIAAACATARKAANAAYTYAADAANAAADAAVDAAIAAACDAAYAAAYDAAFDDAVEQQQIDLLVELLSTT